jgi:hypothetical protein
MEDKMKTALVALATAILLVGCGRPSSAGHVITGGPNPGVTATAVTGFFSTADLTESSVPSTTQQIGNRRINQQTTGNTCLSLAKLSAYLRLNQNEPILVNNYDLALGQLSTTGFQYSNRDDLESNFLLTGAQKVSLVFNAEHISDVFPATPAATALSPDDPTTLFNFSSQDVCNTVTLSVDKSSTAYITNPSPKSVKIVIGTTTYIYTLGNNAIQVSTYKPVQTTVCSTGNFVQKNSYLFSFQTDMQTVRVAKNLYGLLSTHISEIKDELQGLKSGVMPTPTYILAAKDIAAGQATPSDCSK